MWRKCKNRGELSAILRSRPSWLAALLMLALAAPARAQEATSKPASAPASATTMPGAASSVEQWDTFEVSLKGSAKDNPFDV